LEHAEKIADPLMVAQRGIGFLGIDFDVSAGRSCGEAMRKSRFFGVRWFDSGVVHQALKGLPVYSTALYLFFCSTVFGK
jgi:hypothetical protein